MHFSTALALSLAGLAAAGIDVTGPDVTGYAAGAGVEPAFEAFVAEYYRVSEDKLARAAYLDLWTPTAVMILQGRQFDGAAAMLAVRNRLLPYEGPRPLAPGTVVKTWHHLIRGAEVAEESPECKTYGVDIVVQTTYRPGNCSQAHGHARFSFGKTDGQVDLTPHDQNLAMYNLTVNTVDSPTSEACDPVYITHVDTAV